MTWGSLLVLLGFLDSRSQESPIGIGTGHRLATDFSNSVQKRGTQSFEGSGRRHESDNKGVSWVEVLEGEAGNSFYGSRLGGSFLWSVEAWSRIPRVMVLWIPLWIFKGNDNGNSNDGETL